MASDKAFRVPQLERLYFLLAISQSLCYTVSMTYKSVYEKNAAFYNARPKCKKCLILANYAVTGAFFLAYFALCIASFFLFEKKDIIKIFTIPACCLLLVSILRLLIRRPRPYSAEGANITPLIEKKNTDKKSFPSRHVACAFVIAAVFLAYLRYVGAALLPFGGLLAYTRFALGVHYPTDLFGGMGIGLLCGLFLLL